MDKKELFDGLEGFSQSLMVTLAEVETLKRQLQEVVDENTHLRIENARLRERLQQEEIPEKNDTTDSLINLGRIYEDGFHICNDFYAQRRENDEPCMFCLELLDRE